MTHKDKLKEIILVLNKKNVKEIQSFEAIKLFVDFYGVKEKTAREYLREMVLYGFFERPVSGACFKVRDLK